MKFLYVILLTLLGIMLTNAIYKIGRMTKVQIVAKEDRYSSKEYRLVSACGPGELGLGDPAVPV